MRPTSRSGHRRPDLDRPHRRPARARPPSVRRGGCGGRAPPRRPGASGDELHRPRVVGGEERHARCRPARPDPPRPQGCARPGRPVASGVGAAGRAAGRRVDLEPPRRGPATVRHERDDRRRVQPAGCRSRATRSSRAGRCRPSCRSAGPAPARAATPARSHRRDRRRAPGWRRRAQPASTQPTAASQRPSGDHAGGRDRAAEPQGPPSARRLRLPPSATPDRPDRRRGCRSAFGPRGRPRTRSIASVGRPGDVRRRPSRRSVSCASAGAAPGLDDVQVLPVIDVARLVHPPVDPRDRAERAAPRRRAGSGPTMKRGGPASSVSASRWPSGAQAISPTDRPRRRPDSPRRARPAVGLDRQDAQLARCRRRGRWPAPSCREGARPRACAGRRPPFRRARCVATSRERRRT